MKFFLDKYYSNFKNIILENFFISLILILITLLFSDFTYLNSYLKINILNFFFISNFFEIFYLNKLTYYKYNIFISCFIFALIFQIYIFSIFINSIKSFKLKLDKFFLLISLLYFIYNILNQNYNLLPFDKLWLIIFFNKKFFK